MKHVVSVSGGKDSTAVLILARLKWGLDVEAVFADTGHEHPATYEYLETLDFLIGPIRTVRADFTRRMAYRRDHLVDRWVKDGIPEDRARRVAAEMKPTGNPFLDLCVLKGRFPSTRARFCSEELKHVPIRDQVVEPLLTDGHTVVSWQGVRADESRSRSLLPGLDSPEEGLLVYRPIIDWAADQVFALHREHGIPWNPLYEQGMGRVGCMPCIHARKGEVEAIAARFPEEIARVRRWEQIVRAMSRHGVSSFFAQDKTPKGRREPDTPQLIDAVVGWSRENSPDEPEEAVAPACSSIYGLCEAVT